MLALTDQQMERVMTRAADLPADKRSVFLERIAARLRLRDRQPFPITDTICTPSWTRP